MQDCEINPFRPTEPQNHTKKELTRRQASHFLQLVPGLPCVVGPGLPSNQVECVVLSIIPCVCEEPDFPFTWDGVDGADGADGAWQTDRLLTSTASVRLRFPENSIIELNHALFMGCRAIASPLHPDCKYSNLTPYGVQKQSKPIEIAPCMSQKGVGSTIEEIAISGCGARLRVVPAIPTRFIPCCSILYWNLCHCTRYRVYHGQHRVFCNRGSINKDPGTKNCEKRTGQYLCLHAFLSGQTVCLFSVTSGSYSPFQSTECRL